MRALNWWSGGSSFSSTFLKEHLRFCYMSSLTVCVGPSALSVSRNNILAGYKITPTQFKPAAIFRLAVGPKRFQGEIGPIFFWEEVSIGSEVGTVLLR